MDGVTIAFIIVIAIFAGFTVLGLLLPSRLKKRPDKPVADTGRTFRQRQ